MANPVRAFGCAVPLAANLTIDCGCVVSDGTSDFTLNAALPSLVLGTYTPHGWLNHGAKKLRQWVYDSILADAGITTKPPAVTSVDLSLGLPPANVIAGMGTSLVHFHIGNLNCSTVNGPVKIKEFTFNNSNAWASYFGLTYADESGGARRIITPVFGDPLEVDGRYQPRWFYVSRAHYKDTGDQEEKAAYFTRSLADGSQSCSEFGEPEWVRGIEIVSQQRNMTGPAVVIGKFSGFGAGRHILNLNTIDETLLYQMTGTYLRSDQLAAATYLRVGKANYPLRYRQTVGNALHCVEAMPAGYTPNVDDDIEMVADLHALTLEWGRTKKFLPYEPKEATGETSWISKTYGPNREGAWKIGHEKPGRAPLFSMKFEGKRNLKPGWSAP